jgi:predicted  nucleic acid-binding Zn-ribbon protein
MTGQESPEVDALRTEIAELRHSQDDLQQTLRNVQETAHALSCHRKQTPELQIASAQSESAKMATESALSEYQKQLQQAEATMAAMRAELEGASGQRKQLEVNLLNALESREQSAQKLDETRVELERASKNLEQERAQWAEQMNALKERQDVVRLTAQNAAPIHGPHDVAALISEAESASHAGVGAFWLSMDASGQHTVQSSQLENGPQMQGIDPFSDTSDSLLHGETGVEAPAQDMAAAMQAALAAAKAEVIENQSDETPLTKQRSRAASKRSRATVPASLKAPAKPAAIAHDATSPNNKAIPKNAPPPEMPIELDAETRARLKTLKRLDPSKSERELLAAIRAEGPQLVKPKAKRGWFATR